VHSRDTPAHGPSCCTSRNFTTKYRSRQELGKKRARTLTNFDRGSVDFRHMGVLVSRINTQVYDESVQEMFSSFTLKTYVSKKYELIHLVQS